MMPNLLKRHWIRLAIAASLSGVPAAALAAQDVPAETPAQAQSSLGCLAAAVYYEARSESEAGQRAVAQVVLNRVRHRAYPKSVCEVVFQGAQRSTGCQFTFTCDGSLARRPDTAGWNKAVAIASDALEGRSASPVGDATHYHTKAVMPYWSRSLNKLATLGSHIFYGGRGKPAFVQATRVVDPGAARLEQLVVSTGSSEDEGSSDGRMTVTVHRGTAPLLSR